MAYAFMFCILAGVLSLPHRKGVVAGKFPRDVRHPVYFHRRMHGLCWTSLYYFKPVYYLCLTIPTLKRATFRLFGYRGSLDFTAYPDTWIRDLPLLSIGKGVYLSNRATIGTNIATRNGSIVVSGITIDDGALIGHLSMLAPGVHVGKQAEIGVGCGVGLQVELGDRAYIGPCCAIDSGASFLEESSVGAMSYVGKRTVVGAGVSVPSGALLPSRQKITPETDLEQYVSSATVKKLKPKDLEQSSV
ncbi:hypothetical protein OP10G_3413 [Fimbriimonas ginsengisoli Gsoil 348]|uniref:Uncharacterized protein n=1 Tax=Fimbriimonas ginsengisoli Gsoil 348 TaxID=661478 RepID=A0A068NTK8_FIMGI|nr:hypothetical protein OP10G_3413 [Fimbriimonas ginsengisoli Gsoil 348]